MNKEQLDAIANRKTTCHPFGETVSISRKERDSLVAMARRYMLMRSANPDGEIAIPMTHECNSWGRWYYLPMQGKALDKHLDAALTAEIGKNMEKV